MGRKRTAEDYQRTAEENGWVAGAYEEEDSIQQTKDEDSDKYKASQQRALNQWKMWVLDSGNGLTSGLQVSSLTGMLTGFMQVHVDKGRSCLGVPAEELPGP